MKKIVIGLLLVLLDLSININFKGGHINLLPDFLGYIIVFLGLSELEKTDGVFENPKGVCIANIVYSAVIFVLEIMDRPYSEFAAFALTVVGTILHLLLLYMIIKSVGEVETQREILLNYENLKAIWQLMVAVQILGLILSLLSNITSIFTFLAIIALLGIVVISIAMLVNLNKTRKLYDEFVLGIK